MSLLPRALIALPILCLAAMATAAQAAEKPRTISVSATGSVTAEPDMATVRAGVVSDADTAAEALARNSGTMRKVLDGLRASGIAARDIQTTQLDIQPRMDHPKDGRAPRVIGYRVSNIVVVVVRDIKALGGIIDKVVTLGANRLDGIQFDISGVELKLDEARRVAMRNAMRRASLYAQAGGASLGQVLTISENVSGGGPVHYGRARTAAMAAPVAPGEMELAVTVNVTWSLK